MEKEQLKELINKREQLDREIAKKQLEGSKKWFKELSLSGKIILAVILLVGIVGLVFLGILIGGIVGEILFNLME